MGWLQSVHMDLSMTLQSNDCLFFSQGNGNLSIMCCAMWKAVCSMTDTGHPHVWN